MAVLDYAKTPSEAIREMADLYKRMADDDRKHAAVLLESAEAHEKTHDMWRRAAEAIEEVTP